MSDCLRHKKDLFGESDMKKVAEAIGDLHYETLTELFNEMQKKFKADSRKDWWGKRVQLSIRLQGISNAMKFARISASEAWQISKPFMEQKK